MKSAGVRLSGLNKGRLSLAQGAKLEVGAGMLSDRGVICSVGGTLTAAAASEGASESAVTAGEYIWNGSLFAKDDSSGYVLMLGGAELDADSTTKINGTNYSYVFDRNANRGTLTLSGYSNNGSCGTIPDETDEEVNVRLALYANFPLVLELAEGTVNTLTVPDSATEYLTGVCMDDDAELTIRGAGSLNVSAGSTYVEGGESTGIEAGDVIMGSCDVRVLAGAADAGSFGIAASSIQVTGGTFTASGEDCGVDVAGLTVSGGSVTGNGVRGVTASEITVSGTGAVVGNGGDTTDDYFQSAGVRTTFATVSDSGTVKGAGGNTTGAGAASYGVYVEGNVNISGGSITGRSGDTAAAASVGVIIGNASNVTGGMILGVAGIAGGSDSDATGLSMWAASAGTLLYVSDVREGTGLKTPSWDESFYPYGVNYVPVATENVFYRDGSRLTSNTDSIKIDDAQTDVIYSFKQFDQLGMEMSPVITWGKTTPPENVSAIDGSVTVNATAAAGQFDLTVSSGGVTLGTLTVNVMNKTDVSGSITFTDGSATYTGRALSYRMATYTGAASGTGGITYIYAVPTGSTGELDADGMPVDAGVYTVTAHYEDDTQWGEKTVSYTVNKATPVIANVTVSTPSQVYDTTPLSGITLAHTDGIAGTLALSAGQTLAAGTNSYNWTFTPADTDNYNSAEGWVSITVRTDVVWSIRVTREPDKTTYKHNETFDKTGMEITATYASGASKLVSNSDVTVSYTTGTALKKGDSQVTLYYGSTSTTQNVTVNKRTAPALSFADANVSFKYNVTGTQTPNVNGIPGDAGAITYAAGVTGTPGIVTVPDGTTSYAAYTLTGLGAAGGTATITVTVTTANYEDATAVLTVTLTAKDVPAASAENISVTYTGDPVPASAITGTASVSGTWSWKAGQNVTNVSDSGVKTVVFTPTDAENYAAVEKEITVAILKVTPTGAPKYTAITEAGKTLADAALDIGSIIPAGGSIVWEQGNDQTVAANTAYAWTYTPDDTTNYNNLTGSVTPYSVSTGGGGGTATTPTANPATTGNTTTVTTTVTPSTSGTTAIATVTEKAVTDAATSAVTEAAKNSTQPVVEIKVNASATATEVQTTIPTAALSAVGNKGADLQITTPVGNVKLPAEAVSSIVSAAGTANVTLTVKTVEKNALTQAQRNMLGDSDALIIDLTLTAGSKTISQLGGTVEVSIPYTPKAGEGMSKKVVWFLSDDGSITPCTGSFDAKTNTYTFEVTHFSAYVLATFPFTDVAENAWYYGDVAYAYTNGLFAGTSDTTFSPNDPMTRQMLWTVLGRLDGQTLEGFGVFDAARTWAMGKGITDGSNPGSSITREQLVTILWRYAGSPKSTGDLSGFTDRNAVADYAEDAMAWAVEKGIVSGTSATTLTPDGPATRAQVAAILRRFAELAR